MRHIFSSSVQNHRPRYIYPSNYRHKLFVHEKSECYKSRKITFALLTISAIAFVVAGAYAYFSG